MINAIDDINRKFDIAEEWNSENEDMKMKIRSRSRKQIRKGLFLRIKRGYILRDVGITATKTSNNMKEKRWIVAMATKRLSKTMM